MDKKIIDISSSLTKMEFNTKEIRQFIISHGFIYFSWGCSEMSYIDGQGFSEGFSKGLLMKVNGHHHNGYVLIVLDYSDTFDLYYISNSGQVIDEKHMIYIDMLFDTIDERIEKIPEYIR